MRYVGILKITLCVFTSNLFNGIDKQYFAAFCRVFECTAYYNAGFHRSIKEEVRSKPDYAVNHIALNEFCTHFFFFVAEQDSVREKYCATTRTRIHTRKNMLEESIISTALWRSSEEVSSVLIRFKCCSIPLLNRVRRISQYKIELLKLTVLNERWSFQCVIIYDVEVLNAMKEEIHPTNGRRKLIDFLTVNLYVSPFLVLLFQISNTRNQHSGTSACRVIYRLSGLRFQNLSHQMYDRAVSIELLRGMAAIISELFNQVFVPLTELIFWAVSDRKRFTAEMLYQIFQKGIGKTIFIRPCTVAENAVELVDVSLFYGMKGIDYGKSDIFRNFSNVFPMVAFRHDESMKFFLVEIINVVTVLFYGCFCFLIIYIANSLEEKKREYVLFICTRINAGAEKNCRIPQIGFEFIYRNSITHSADPP